MVLVFRGFVYQAGLTLNRLNISLLSFGTGMLLLWLHHRPTSFMKWRALNGLRRMGQFSYEIYLTHMFVIIIDVKLFTYLQLNETWLIPTAVILILCCYGLGAIAFNYFSNPVNQWLRQRYKSLSPKL